METPIRIFYCYARRDEAQRKEIEKQLSPLVRLKHIEGWSDENILPGTTWEEEINQHIDDANLILLLISPDFLYSEYCQKEMEKALKRLRNGDVYVIPVILRPVIWELTSISELQVLPKDGEPISRWSDPDEAFLNVAHGIARILLEGGALSPQEASFLEKSNASKTLASTAATASVEVFDETGREDWESSRLLRQVRARLESEREKALRGRIAISLKLRDPAGAHVNLRPAQLLNKIANELLILGELGSGKTQLLLDLGLELCERANHRESESIPVLLPLSSWAERRQPIARWAAQAIADKFKVKLRVSQKWLQSHKILLLLDGLDQVPAAYQGACIEAIDVYRRQDSVVVCCRSADYEAQKPQLKWDKTVIVQPLSREQVNRYVANAGRSLLAVRKAMEDAAMQKLVTTPLMLHVLIDACQGMAAADMRSTRRSGLERKLLERYIQHMLNDQAQNATSAAYTQDEVKERLAWLAWELTRHNQQVFFTKQIQPSWLATPQSWWPVLDIVVRWFIGVHCGLLGGLLTGQFFGSWLRQVWRIQQSGSEIVLGILGVVLGLGLGILFSLSLDFPDEGEQPSSGKSRLFRGLLDAALPGYLLGWVCTFFHLPQTAGLWVWAALTLGLFFLLLVFGLVDSEGEADKNRPKDDNKPKPNALWNEIQDIRALATPKKGLWRAAPGIIFAYFRGFGILWCLGACVVIALLLYKVMPVSWGVGWLIAGLFCLIELGIVFMFINLLLRALFRGTVGKEKLERRSGKQSIWSAAGQSLLIGPLYGLLGGLLGWLIVAVGPLLLHNSFGISQDSLGSIQGWIMQVVGITGDPLSTVGTWLGEGLGIGIGSGIVLFMLFGGAACIRYLVVRALMTYMAALSIDSESWGYLRYAYIPENRYREFLKYAAYCGFLREAAGGYCFIHPRLQQVFSRQFETIRHFKTVESVSIVSVEIRQWLSKFIEPLLTAMREDVLKDVVLPPNFLRFLAMYFYAVVLALVLGASFWTSVRAHYLPAPFSIQETLSSAFPQRDGLTLITSHTKQQSREFASAIADHTLLLTNNSIPCKQIVFSLSDANQKIKDSQGNVFTLWNAFKSYIFPCKGYLFLGNLDANSDYRPGGTIRPIQGLNVIEVPLFQPITLVSVSGVQKMYDNVLYAAYMVLQQQDVAVPLSQTFCLTPDGMYTETITTILPVACAAFTGDALYALKEHALHLGRGDQCTLSQVQLDQSGGFLFPDRVTVPTSTHPQTFTPVQQPPGVQPAVSSFMPYYNDVVGPYFPISTTLPVSVTYTISGNCWY